MTCRTRTFALVAAALAFASPVRADIKIVVPYAPGGSADLMARLLGPGLQQRLGEHIIIENRGGAGGALGNEIVARAAPDGKTILVANLGSHVIAPLTRPPVGYEQAKAFEPIVLMGAMPAMMAIRPEIPANTFAELVAWAKAGNKLTFGSAGSATTMHISGELFNAGTGAKATHVPYRGVAPAMNDLLGGHLDMIIADIQAPLPHVRSGKMRALALFAAERSPLAPEVPSTKELGYPDMRMENWYGVLAPAGTPPDLLAKYEQAALEIVTTSPVKEKLAEANVLGVKDRAGFKAQLDRDFVYWATQIKTLGITAE